MKKSILSLLASFIFIVPCFAESTFNGLYLGADAGYESGNTKFIDGVTNTDLKTDFEGSTWGVDAGLGHSLLHFLYLGMGVKYQNFSGATAKASDSDNSVKLNDAIFLVITPGLLITQKTLLYANLGAGEVNAEYSQDSSVKSVTSTDGPHNSWSAIYGVGLKRGLNDYISIGAEYNHVVAGSAGLSNNVSSLDYNEGLVNLTFYL